MSVNYGNQSIPTAQGDMSVQSGYLQQQPTQTVQAMLNDFHARLAAVCVNLGAVLGQDIPPQINQQTSAPQMNIAQSLTLIENQIGDIAAKASAIRMQVGVL